MDPGKWLVFVNESEVDEVLEKIKRTTEEGCLGDSAKVSTAYPKQSYDPSKWVICVYAMDSYDEEEVMRIRDELKEIGITRKIPYKADSDTRARRYAVRGDRNISRYYA